MEKELMQIKKDIVDLFGKLLDVTKALGVINTQVDDLLLQDDKPEPQAAPRRPEAARQLKPTQPGQVMLSEATGLPQAEAKPSIIDRVLGKDASAKQKQRNERMKALEAELAELSKKG